MNSYVRLYLRDALDILLVTVLFLLAELAATQSEEITDWTAWFRTVLVLALYRALPSIMAIVMKIREKLGTVPSPGE